VYISVKNNNLVEKPGDTYRCWFFINQNVQFRSFIADENAAADIFVKFLANKDYGKAIRWFRFDIYVEPEINFGLHRDIIYTGCAQMSAHINYERFVSADSEHRLQMLLNAAFVLCKYLADKLPLPKNFDANGLVQDYSKFLEEKDLLITDAEFNGTVIKPFETTRFNFLISTTAEVKEKEINYDLTKIQDYLNNHLSGKTFGKSVRQFDFGYEIADFQGNLKPWPQTANLKRYGTKYKNILVVKQFDYRYLKGKSPLEQFNILKSKIIEAIDDIDQLNKKPKDFDKETFKLDILNLLTEYCKRYCD
jgi:hypothetical protein